MICCDVDFQPLIIVKFRGCTMQSRPALWLLCFLGCMHSKEVRCSVKENPSGTTVYTFSRAMQTPLSTFTEAYPAPGWFTGVKSAITIHKPASVVYDSLAKDLQRVFTPMSVS